MRQKVRQQRRSTLKSRCRGTAPVAQYIVKLYEFGPTALSTGSTARDKAGTNLEDRLATATQPSPDCARGLVHGQE